MNGNSNSLAGYVELDQSAPEIAVISPEATIYTTNSIELSYSVNEECTQSYVLDSSVYAVNSTSLAAVTIQLNLSSGPHTIYVNATDPQDNIGISEIINFSIADENTAVIEIDAEPFWTGVTRVFFTVALIRTFSPGL